MMNAIGIKYYHLKPNLLHDKLFREIMREPI